MKRNGPLEKDIEAAVCAYARTKGFLTYKFSSPSHAAVPDRLLIKPRVTLFIEFKRKGAKPTPAQEREHARLREAGATVFVIDNIEDGKVLVDFMGAAI